MLARSGDSVLVIVDIQDRLLAGIPLDARETMVRNTKILIRAAACLGIPVLATEQYPKGLGPTIDELAEALPSGSQRLAKTCFSCAGSESFSAALEATGRSQVILAGMEAHVCVLQTALELRAAGREVFVVEDAWIAALQAARVQITQSSC